MDRNNLYRYLDKTKPTMEIGPRDRPFLTKDKFNVYYADIRSAEDVKQQLYKNLELEDVPVPIDFIIKGTYKETVGNMSFAAAFSSHVIEHTIDIIGHLREISECLEEGGRYIICAPDRRFTFDYFREVTPFRDAYDVYINGDAARKRLVFDYFFNTEGRIPNNSKEYMAGDVSFRDIAGNSDSVNAALDKVQIRNEIVGGLHYWVFTFRSFLALLRDCFRLNLLPYTLEDAAGPVIVDNEFQVVLRKDSSIMENDNFRKDEIIRINDMIEHPPGQQDLSQFITQCERVYFYGSVVAAEYIYNRMPKKEQEKVSGLVISDGFTKEPSILPVFWISEISRSNETGLMIVLTGNPKQQVLESLGANSGFRILDTVYID